MEVMEETIRFGCATHNGNVRDHNEDSYVAKPEFGLWLVADGMGGHMNGDIASKIVSDTVSELVGQGKDLPIAIQYAHSAIIKSGKNGVGNPGMGSTVVALQVDGNGYEIAWVGDSRAYLWDGNQLHQITKDHSYVQMLLDEGTITVEEALTHPEKNIIYQCMGSLEHDTVEVSTVLGEFYAGHKIILCSDGLNDEVSEEDIATIVSADQSEQATADALVSAALAATGKDNITVLLISASEAAPSEGLHSMKPFETQIFEVDVGLTKKQKILIAVGVAGVLALVSACYFFY